MPTYDITEPLGQACSLVSQIPHTFISAIWAFISLAFSLYWYFIIPALITWIFFEIVTMGTHSYNSENGFTPLLNSVVGGGVFYAFSALINLIFGLIFGNGGNCVPLWLNSFYLIPFVSTGLLLHWTGFWPYLKVPIINEKIRLFRR